MNTCANRRHWRPHAGSPTNMVCGIIRSNRNASPRIILDLVRPKPADYPMLLATASDFGCVLYEDQPPVPTAHRTAHSPSPIPHTPHGRRPLAGKAGDRA